MRVPFGAKVHFISAPGSRTHKELCPFDSSASVGIFLGWVMDAGCKFKGKYRVASLNDFDNIALVNSSASAERRVYSTVTSRIAWPTEIQAKDPNIHWEFPLLARYERANETADGRASVGAPGHREGIQRPAHPGSQGVSAVPSSYSTTAAPPPPSATLGHHPAQSSAPAEPALEVPADDGHHLFPATAKPPDPMAAVHPLPPEPAAGASIGTLDPAAQWPFTLTGKGSTKPSTRPRDIPA